MKAFLVAGLSLMSTMALADEKPIPSASIIPVQTNSALCYDHGLAFSVGAVLDGRMCQAGPGQATQWAASTSVVRIRPASTPACGPGSAPPALVTTTGPFGYTSSHYENPPSCPDTGPSAIAGALDVLKFGSLVVYDAPYIARGVFYVARFGVKVLLD